MTRPTITEQRQAVEELLDFTEPGDGRIAVEQAILTLAWLERRAELVKEIERLDREVPALAVLLKAFPDAKIEAVR
jgi:hypothetical protein